MLWERFGNDVEVEYFLPPCWECIEWEEYGYWYVGECIVSILDIFGTLNGVLINDHYNSVWRQKVQKVKSQRTIVALCVFGRMFLARISLKRGFLIITTGFRNRLGYVSLYSCCIDDLNDMPNGVK
jgi:hypothetical protein